MYEFPYRDEFLDRRRELAALEEWWAGDEELPVLVLYGRRRAGKSWLLREFAHGKDAHIFVCETRTATNQLTRLAEGLTQLTGVVPRLRNMTDFYQAVYQAPAPRLIVIDEFPELFGRDRHPDSELAAVLETLPARTPVKLLLCGSHVGAMERLLHARAPLHGRARPLRLDPFSFWEAREFLAGREGADLVERYAIAGGMPRHLRALARPEPLTRALSRLLLDQNGPFFNEPRTVLDMELSDPAVYFVLLEALARHREMEWGELVNEAAVASGTASRYMRTLEDLSIVEATAPVLARPGSRRNRYRVRDGLMRFWFRYVFPYQDALTTDLRPDEHCRRNIAPSLGEFVAPVFEAICRSWALRTYGTTTDRIGSWWGPARHDARRAGHRTSEEIDVVGVRGRSVTVIGECKWQRRPMPVTVLHDLREHKLPALRQAGADAEGAQICLFSRAGFAPDLEAEAARAGLRLVPLDELAGAFRG